MRAGAARADFIFALGSLALALLFGVAFGILTGVPLDQAGNITIRTLFDLLHPFALWFGVLTIVLLALHGGGT